MSADIWGTGTGGPATPATPATPEREEEPRLWLAVPTGFFELPLDDLDARLGQARTLITELAPGEQQAAIDPVVGALGFFLQRLAELDALYCGIGHHRSGYDDSEITSTLIVSLQRTGGTGDARKLLGEMARRQADDGWTGEAEILEVEGRPVLFCESVREVPAPQFPEGPPVAQDATVAVFELRALVPSSDGQRLAAIDFATPCVAYGPEFRTMLVMLAASVSFEEPVTVTSSIRDVLG